MLAACEGVPASSYNSIYEPEKLLTQIDDPITIDLSTAGSYGKLNEAIRTHPPLRALANCDVSVGMCRSAVDMLAAHHIATETSGADNKIILVYEHTEAMDCDQRYTDNSLNHYNLNHSSFGCSVSANMAQQVSDKRQFTNPGLLDYTDGEHAAAVYKSYTAGPVGSPVSSGGVSTSMGASTLSSGSSGGN